KPATALCNLADPIQLPKHGKEIHHEIELAVIIGTEAKNIQVDDVEKHIGAYALAIDLTIRDVQAGLKERGHPWEIAKAFDGSCPISHIVEPSACEDWQDVDISLCVNGEVRQSSSTALMIHKINALIAYISSIFTLEAGDIVLCGTPAGVAALDKGDALIGKISDQVNIKASIA
ncbi:MAG: fumarylacetoacetate hydrolase family protein, partial [Planctomycetes bacterium]|nr:fumarylacetoacetate hydrolase family protein [Planctomycetota bacterium]